MSDYELPAEYPLGRVMRLRKTARECGAHFRFIMRLEQRVIEEAKKITDRVRAARAARRAARSYT